MQANTQKSRLQLLTAAEVAELLRTSREGVWNLIDRNELEVITLRGIGCRIPKSSVVAFLSREGERTNDVTEPKSVMEEA